MASTSEIGHAKNVANFEQMITYAKSYATKYNPSQPAIKTTALDTLSASATTSMKTLNNAEKFLVKQKMPVK